MVTVPKPDPANFRLSVKDFGPIVEADIDFRPLTVFVGPSNTGKSYLAVLTYALHQVLMEDRYSPGAFRATPAQMRMPRQVSEEDAKKIQEWMRNADFTRAIDLSEIEEIVVSTIRNYFQDTAIEVFSEIRRCFGVEDISHFHRMPTSHRSTIRLSKDEFVYNMDLSQEPHASTVQIPSLPQFPLDGSTQSLLEHFFYRGDAKSDARLLLAPFLQRITHIMAPRFLGSINHPVYYLPADRAGVMHAHRTVMSALIQRAQYAGIRRDESVILLSGVLGDFLQHLIEIGQSSPRQNLPRRRARKKHLIGTATDLEKQVLKGAIRNVRSQTGYPSFLYRPDSWTEDLPLLNGSSMVSELAPVVLFLRHIVEHKDVLIIEEPESHLHPAMQVEFTRVLAGAVKAGLRVILTTHSEWVVETVGNLVELWGVPEGRRESLPGGEYALPPEAVGVWLFQEKEGESGSVVTEVERDPDTGVYGVGYDDIAIALNNEWANAAPEKPDSR